MLFRSPGFGGQQFIENSLRKIEELKTIIVRENAATLIEVDGGVTAKNAPQLYAAGADILVAGNAVFATPNPTEAIAKIKE